VHRVGSSVEHKKTFEGTSASSNNEPSTFTAMCKCGRVQTAAGSRLKHKFRPRQALPFDLATWQPSFQQETGCGWLDGPFRVCGHAGAEGKADVKRRLADFSPVAAAAVAVCGTAVVTTCSTVAPLHCCFHSCLPSGCCWLMRTRHARKSAVCWVALC
jgi:hypothetical protein